MACCPSTILFFAGQLTSTIAYPDSMKAIYGQKPRVDVYYFDLEVGEFYNNNGTPVPPSFIKFTGSNIIIDHGGSASGYVKIS